VIGEVSDKSSGQDVLNKLVNDTELRSALENNDEMESIENILIRILS
jgi:hypothetical protein